MAWVVMPPEVCLDLKRVESAQRKAKSVTCGDPATYFVTTVARLGQDQETVSFDGNEKVQYGQRGKVKVLQSDWQIQKLVYFPRCLPA